MFDPHRIGPRRSSSYARNKGRVIQRRLVDTPSPGYTRTELEELVPLMRKNGFIPEIPPGPSPNFGRMVSYSVIADGLDITNDYRELTEDELYRGYVTLSGNNEVFLLVIPNYDFGGQNSVVFLTVRAVDAGNHSYVGLTEGTRVYSMGNRLVVDSLILTGENGTSITVYLPEGKASVSTQQALSVTDGSFAVPM